MTSLAGSRLATVLLVVAAIAGLGYLVQRIPGSGVEIQVKRPDASTTTAAAGGSSYEHARQPLPAEVEERFHQAVLMLHAKQYDYAVAALHRVLELAPTLPEAHVNMGFALLGQEAFKAAHDFFQSALALRPMQVNAYYGLGAALEGLSDREGAIGAMRTYLHLAAEDDPYRRKAEAALWEWGGSPGFPEHP